MILGLIGFDNCAKTPGFQVVLFSNMEDGVWGPVWEVHRLVEAGAFDQ